MHNPVKQGFFTDWTLAHQRPSEALSNQRRGIEALKMSPTQISSAAGTKFAVALLLLSTTFLAGCGNDSVTHTPAYQVGGVVTGLVGSGLVLANNGSNNLTVSENGAFHFTSDLTNGSSYAVTVVTQPGNPSQNCIITNGTGSISGSSVTTVQVTCSTNGYTIGGNVSGLTGSGLVLEDNGGDELTINQSGPFTFAQTIGSGVGYAVTVKTQPTNPAQICAISNGSGTVSSANVGNVAVTCATNTFSVSGTITGLLGTGLVLQTNGVTATISGNTFSFAQLPSGTAYNVTVTTPPTNPTQSCVVANGQGTLTNANVSGVSVTCSTTQTFTVSGTITGLVGSGLVLQNNSAPITLSGNSFSFTLASGVTYNIGIGHQPSSPSQTCTVTNGSGTITVSNATVAVNCVTNTYSISVNVSGLNAGATSLALLDNGGDSLGITGNATFTFATKVASGAAYAVTVGVQPTVTPAQYCIVQNGSGTVAAANVTNVSLTCRNVGQALFVANTYDGTNGDISGFMINAANGNLASSGAPVTANLNPSAIALDPVGQIAYVANLNSADVSTYGVSSATAVLTPLVTAPGYGTSGVLSFSVVVDPAATNFVFVGSDSGGASGYVDFYNATAGVLALNGASPIAAGNDPLVMAADPTGAFLFATDRYDDAINVYSITAGVLSNVSNSPFTNGAGSAPVGVTVYPGGGYIYVAGAGSGTLTAYAYDAVTGVLTPLTTPYPVGSGATSAPTAVAIDPTARFLYVTALNDNTISEFSIAPLTGLLTAVGAPLATGNGPADVKIEPSGHYLYVANRTDGTVGEYTIDPNSGALTVVTSGGTVVSGTQAQAIAIE